MRIQLPNRLIALLTAFGICGAGCTKGPDESTRLESAAAVAPPAQQPAAPATDTPVTAVAPQQPETPRGVKPARRKPVVEPASAASPPAASPESAPPGAAGQEKWLSYDGATNTVTFELIAGPFTFNGYRNGGGTLVVPPQANVVMNFVNKDGTPHSAIVISGEGPIPNAASDPAIPRAFTTKVLEGLPQEGSDVIRFPAPASGTYRIFCGVPGHGLSGMWIWMKIDPTAKAPSFGPTKQ